MLKIAYHPAYIHPVKEGHRFPMEKYERIALELLAQGVVEPMNFFKPDLCSLENLQAAHDPYYVEQLLQKTLDPKMIRRIGFPLDDALIARERYLVQGTITCCQHALQHGISFNIAGGTHHAGYNYGEGFCLINDQGVAARYLLEHQLASKIAIIDLDVHQGNGTADMFLSEERVFTFSMHCEKNYPFIKATSNLDIGLDLGTTDDFYLATLRKAISQVLDKENPDFVFYQAGVDILATDKLGKLHITPQGCQQRDSIVLQACKDRNIPVQVSMGGGYSTELEDIVQAHVQTFRTALDLYNL